MGQLLRQPHVRIENGKLVWITIQKNTDWLKLVIYNFMKQQLFYLTPNHRRMKNLLNIKQVTR